MNRLRPVLALLLLLAFAPLPGSAAPPREPLRASAPPWLSVRGLPARVQGFIRNVMAKTGCAIDPLGRCLPVTNAEPEPRRAGGSAGGSTEDCQDSR